jgi:hypothetical protein
MKVNNKPVTRLGLVYRRTPNLPQCAGQFIGAHTAVAQKRYAELTTNAALLPTPNQKPRRARLTKILYRIGELKGLRIAISVPLLPDRYRLRLDRHALL